MIEFLYWLNRHPEFLIMLILSFSLISLLIYSYFKNKKSAEEVQIFLASIPLAGPLFRLWNTYYIAYHLSTLLKNGISLYQSLKLIMDDPKKKYLKTIIEKMNLQLMAGDNLAQSIRSVPIWQNEFSHIIHHGSLSGRLDIELETYSQACIDSFFDKIEKTIKIVQPIMFSFIALWILIMYFSIMLPSFQMINQI